MTCATDHPVTAFDEPSKLSAHGWKAVLASGVLAVVLGVLVLAWPGKTVLVASVLFGVYLLVIGCAQLFTAFVLDVSAGGRILLFISGAVSLILAILTFRHFGEAFAVLLLAIWIGVGFMMRGVATTVAAISDRAQPGRGWDIFFGLINVLAGLILIALPFTSILTLAIVAGVWLVVIGVFEIVSAFYMRQRGETRIPVKVRTP
jgi:uncharacterized membrane protein HdeD (DUF308 family)